MTLTQQLLTIAVVALGTMLTRFLPFLVFTKGKPTPRYIQYLGKVLPGAVFGLLIVYCLKTSHCWLHPMVCRKPLRSLPLLPCTFGKSRSYFPLQAALSYT